MIPHETEPVRFVLSREEAEACLDAISDFDWAYYLADYTPEFLDALKAKLRALVS